MSEIVITVKPADPEFGEKLFEARCAEFPDAAVFEPTEEEAARQMTQLVKHFRRLQASGHLAAPSKRKSEVPL